MKQKIKRHFVEFMLGVSLKSLLECDEEMGDLYESGEVSREQFLELIEEVTNEEVTNELKDKYEIE